MELVTVSCDLFCYSFKFENFIYNNDWLRQYLWYLAYHKYTSKQRWLICGLEVGFFPHAKVCYHKIRYIYGYLMIVQAYYIKTAIFLAYVIESDELWHNLHLVYNCYNYMHYLYKNLLNIQSAYQSSFLRCIVWLKKQVK